MADREHVSRVAGQMALTFWAALVLIASSLAEAGADAPLEIRGRAIDDFTQEGLSGVFVVGRYTGSIGWGGTSCERLEGAMSDEHGWYTLPMDSRLGRPLLVAYRPHYTRGENSRYAVQLSAHPERWQVWQQKSDAANPKPILLKESRLYSSKKDAENASRERIDVYLRPFTGPREVRLQELGGLSGATICGGKAPINDGPIRFLRAIYAEQVELMATQNNLDYTTRLIDSVSQQDKPMAGTNK